MDDEEWSNGLVRCLGMMLNGHAMQEWDEQGERVTDDVLLILFNAYHEMIRFLIPPGITDKPWELVLDTAQRDISTLPVLDAGRYYLLRERSVVMLTQRITDPA
jgi:glycogen operon protein